jgi:integrase/recombinase XerD
MASGHPMSELLQAIDDYLALRRALGFKLAGHGRLLVDFCEYLDQSGAAIITTEAALAWATMPVGAQPVRWRARLCVVRGFARHLHAVDPRVEVPPADLLPHRHERPTPYLFSTGDIADLLAAAGRIKSPLRAATHQTMFGLLAVTGMRVGEAIRLDRADIDYEAATLSIRESKFGKSRQLALHPSTVAELDLHAHDRERLCRRVTTSSFFVSATGTRLIYTNVRATFQSLVRASGIGSGASARVRIHDLRHSFAVTTLLNWYRDGGHVAARMPLLSAYLGHSSPVSTYWYLQASPDLLALAAQRLEHAEPVRP